ncbi:MAG: hypothetical protein AABY28_02825 [Candidatus Omnitrophota bacterium]|mgnify:FL=1
MDKKMLFLFIIGVSIFAIIIFSINIMIKKYGAESLRLEPPKAAVVTIGAPSENNKVSSKEEPEREPVQTGGPLLQ